MKYNCHSAGPSRGDRRSAQDHLFLCECLWQGWTRTFSLLAWVMLHPHPTSKPRTGKAPDSLLWDQGRNQRKGRRRAGKVCSEPLCIPGQVLGSPFSFSQPQALTSGQSQPDSPFVSRSHQGSRTGKSYNRLLGTSQCSTPKIYSVVLPSYTQFCECVNCIGGG